MENSESVPSEEASTSDSRQNSAASNQNDEHNTKEPRQNSPAQASVHNSEANTVNSRQNSATHSEIENEATPPEQEPRPNSTVSANLPYIKPEKQKSEAKDENRMYSPDDELNIDDFMKNLEEGNLQLTKELDEWRSTYGIELEQDETDNILDGNPSLGGIGLTPEEQTIAKVVVKGKMQELSKMSTGELVDYVRLSSY